MKKLLSLLLILTGCANNNGWHAVIQDRVYAYQTSEVQEYTHDIYLAVCKNNVYIEISKNYKKSYLPLKKTGKMIYYRIYGIEDKVSNKGYEIIKEEY